MGNKSTTTGDKANSGIELDKIVLQNVTLPSWSGAAILENIDFDLPVDQTVVVESSSPQNAVQFLRFLSGGLTSTTGRLLWNENDVFADDSGIDPREFMAAYFEQNNFHSELTVKEFLNQVVPAEDRTTLDHLFDFSEHGQRKMSDLSFEDGKIFFLLQVLCKNPQFLILEDPASGLTEGQWLAFLDFIQYKQRRGYIRHIYMTNHHPTALNHLEHNKIFLEEGIIYFDESAPVKKVAHF